MENTFKWLRPPFMLVPYSATSGLYPPEILVELYNRLKADGLYETVFHDNPKMNLLEFMNFFSHPSTLLQVVYLVDGDTFTDMAGMVWLSGVEAYAGKQRAVGSFVAFQKYQTPAMTDPMTNMVLDYWFNCLNMDIVVGMTPSENHLALRFIKRIGFKEMCRLPSYMALRGQITDCVITFMDKEQFKSIYGGG